ncbi:hypothetical protein L1987_58974 [Smallanthus sonchifolius]|uniref:Uncharacterized protein n=1 Tax=Smallanthus sonchifolius TaxID=185202 RepID=A0ACB9D407_9ASTR|nr:hypothetical protein L1987_58974 [Smallanthus sonchifolius]
MHDRGCKLVYCLTKRDAFHASHRMKILQSSDLFDKQTSSGRCVISRDFEGYSGHTSNSRGPILPARTNRVTRTFGFICFTHTQSPTAFIRANSFTRVPENLILPEKYFPPLSTPAGTTGVMSQRLRFSSGGC